MGHTEGKNESENPSKLLFFYDWNLFCLAWRQLQKKLSKILLDNFKIYLMYPV